MFLLGFQDALSGGMLLRWSVVLIEFCVWQCCTANPDGRRRALVVGGGIANFTDVAATFNGIIRAFREKVNSIIFQYMRAIILDGILQLC